MDIEGSSNSTYEVLAKRDKVRVDNSPEYGFTLRVSIEEDVVFVRRPKRWKKKVQFRNPSIENTHLVSIARKHWIMGGESNE